jgi:hypothetical protein
MEKLIDTERSYAARPPISWGAVFAGWLFAYAFALLLYLLGAAAGITSLAAINRLHSGVLLGTGAWMVAAWLIATFAGSVLAGRLAGFPHRGTGAIHGLIVWALSGIMTLMMASVQAAGAAAVSTEAVKNVAQVSESIGGAAAEGTRGMRPSVPQEIQQSFSNELKERAAQTIDQMPGAESIDRQEARQTIESLDQPTIVQISSALIQGNEQQAKQIFAQKTTLSEQQVDSIVTGLSQSAQEAGAEAKDAAGAAVEQAGDYTSAGLWMAFLSSLLGLLAGAWGGSVGAGMAAKAYYAVSTEYPSVVSYNKPEEHRKVV